VDDSRISGTEKELGPRLVIKVAQQRVAQTYLDDGSVEDACPPLKALLYIMAQGEYQGKKAQDPEIRTLFTKDYLLASNWYRERLRTKQRREINLCERNILSLETFLARTGYDDVFESLDIRQRLEQARQRLAAVQEEAYVDSLVGTLGADPLGPYAEEG